MVAEIAAMARMTSSEIGKEAFDKRVMDIMAKVPRHKFVPDNQRGLAYANHPLPIGHRQTISQPYIVALMTDLLNLKADDQVLEVGTGSGYQAAVLAELVRKVFSIEIVEPLGKQAKARLANLGYDNVEVRIGDGYHGWPAHAPFDAIIVTAAANQIPAPLIQQLKPGGKMIIPVSGRFRTQHLTLVEKDAAGKVNTREVLHVRFVPLTRDH
ncbi:MAG: protein-L-isoaspartate(D-aspartate) O-methyltransferase [Gammaproteobacteria bacterium]|nr:protein-L-isoaspartate(D-aspartate) O-methyltransferase [Gammaproteobacteria bacterium]